MIHYNKTLVIRFSSVGDIVLSSPLIRELRQRDPQAQVDFLIKDAYADLVRHNPHLTNIVTPGRDRGLKPLLRLRKEIRRRRYDTVLDIHGSLRSRFLTFGLRGVRRINKRIIARAVLVHFKRDIYPLFGGSPGVAERYLETMPPPRVVHDDLALDLFVPTAAQERARALLDATGIGTDAGTVGICPSARHFTKVWPEDRFISVAVSLARRWHAPVVVFGGSDDRDRCGMIARKIAEESPGTRIADFSGTTTLLETAAIMDFCRVVVTNDSGLMHVAAARKRPVVAVFGSTVRQLGFFPVGTQHRVVENLHLSCRPCSHIGRSACPRKHFRCMLDVSPQQVLESVFELVGRDQPPVSASSSIS